MCINTNINNNNNNQKIKSNLINKQHKLTKKITIIHGR